jgi:hypothetical protein
MLVRTRTAQISHDDALQPYAVHWSTSEKGLLGNPFATSNQGGLQR